MEQQWRKNMAEIVFGGIIAAVLGLVLWGFGADRERAAKNREHEAANAAWSGFLRPPNE